MPRLALVALLTLMLALTACTRDPEPVTDPTPPPDFGLTPIAGPSPTLEGQAPTDGGGVGDLIPGFPGTTEPTATLLPIPPVAGSTPLPAPTGEVRFSNLRFATTGDGQPQTNFPLGTQEVFAIWDANNMTANDTMTRVWYLNDVIYVEREQAWPFETYGFQNTIRDIKLYDYIDGIDPGTWRVELWLNGQFQVSANFTVGQ